MTADHVFGGDVSRMYQELLVPMIFEDAASEVAARAAAAVPSGGGAVLEVAAGTGAVTRAMCSALPASTAITATDLNQAMLARAIAVGTGGREVRWQQADVMALPFDDASFDVVVCQFGAMFFPDRPAAFSEIHRVLRGGGRFLCSVWDRIESNEVAEVVEDVVAAHLGVSPPMFLRRTPYSYFDRDRIEADVRAGGFTASIRIEPFDAVSRSRSARDAAAAFTEGSVLREEIIAAVGADRLTEVTELATDAVAARFPPDAGGAVTARIKAWVIDAEA